MRRKNGFGRLHPVHRGKIQRRVKVSLVILAVLVVVAVVIGRHRETSALRQLLDTQELILNIFLNDTDSNGFADPGDIADKWRPVFGLQGAVFSAYLDARPGVILNVNRTGEDVTWAEIRIIGVMPVDINETAIDCIYKYRNGNAFTIRRKPVASVTAMKADVGEGEESSVGKMKYNAYFVLCDLDVSETLRYWDVYREKANLPFAVTIGLKGVTNEQIDYESFVNVRYEDTNLLHREDTQDLLAVCIPVALDHYDQPLHLIEFLEYYKLLGVEHFTFYDSSVSPGVSEVLRYYEDFGDVTVIPWNPPWMHMTEKGVRAEENLAILNDCLYRSSLYNNYKYVAVVDTNEFIVPKVHYDLVDLVTYLDSSRPKTSAEFLFSTALFFTDSQNDETNKITDSPFLYTQAKTKRTFAQHANQSLGRYIARGEDAVQLGKTGVKEFVRLSSLPEPERLYVEKNLGLVHRYQACEQNCQTKVAVLDRTAHKYVVELAHRVRHLCEVIFGRGGCPAADDQSDFYSRVERLFL